MGAFATVTTALVAPRAGTGLLAAAELPLSAESPLRYRARLRPAPQRQLFVDPAEGADCNSPYLREAGRSLVFVSAFQPLGHGHRRVGGRSPSSLGPMEPVRIIDDPTPDNGKWIESVMRQEDGRLYGWYHTETRLEGGPGLFLPEIGAMVSDDDGASWRLIGMPFELSPEPPDLSFQNGFVAGGVGDFCAVPDRERRYVYLYATAYGPGETGQGLIALRYPLADADRPHEALEVWAGEPGWRDAGAVPPCPFLAPERGWRYADPTALWGPAIHYNRALGAYAMLLNRTAGGNRDWRQEGVYISFADRLDDPLGWSPPRSIVSGGSWYPQVVGLGAGDGDTLAGGVARLFLSGYSAWDIAFSAERPDAPWPEPLAVDRRVAVAEEATRTTPRVGRGGRSLGRRPRGGAGDGGQR